MSRRCNDDRIMQKMNVRPIGGNSQVFGETCTIAATGCSSVKGITLKAIASAGSPSPR
jgi:hypothetical protein